MWVKCRSNFKPFVDQSSCRFETIRKPLVVCNALGRLCISCFVPKTQAVKFVIKLRHRRKKVVLGPRFSWEGKPQISDMHFQLELLRSMWPVLVEFRSASSKGSWRKKEKEESRKTLSPSTTMSSGLTFYIAPRVTVDALKSNSTYSICCGFVVQQAAQQVHNKSIHDKSKAVQQIHNKSTTNLASTTNPHLDMSRCCRPTTNRKPPASPRQIHNKSKQWSLAITSHAHYELRRRLPGLLSAP